ncbi:MAG TPA: MobF family relaxase [Acidimicrobiales bacterium]|nr:MobF family relaxase [Acidimicrobiales bacterium]
MILSVTALGSRDGGAAAAAQAVVNYLDGRGVAAGGRRPGSLGEVPRPESEGLVGYYADSVEGAGRWLGRGLGDAQPQGEVDGQQLYRALLGQDPTSGEQLVGARGSAVRAERGREQEAATRPGRGEELLSLAQAAAHIGVSLRYLRRLAGEGEQLRERRRLEEASGVALTPFPANYIAAHRKNERGHWKVERGEVERFMASRVAPTAVVGYDLTFSCPKSVSVLWGTAKPAEQEQILAAVDAAVGAGISYLQDHAAYVQGSRKAASGFVAASYLHATSRALEPQLHRHVVVANMTRRDDGEVRALDGRPLFAHARTAGYLAAAELRHQLADRLGLAWDEVHNGLADVVGVSAEAMAEMSTRAGEIAEVAHEIGATSAAARQVAAYDTRAAKEHGVDPDLLRPSWDARLEGVGFGPGEREACYGRQDIVPLVTEEERQVLFATLGSAQGITELAATFDRRDVIQHVSAWARDRLSAREVADVADEWLASPAVVALQTPRRERSGDVIRRADGKVISAVAGETLYTTPELLAVERQILERYDRGRHAGAGVVGAETVDAVLAERATIGDDQAAMVRAMTTSGHRIQCVLGPAGSGKTFALEAAVRAWEADGYQVLGAAVGGTAAEVLQRATGMRSTTVAGLLTRLDTAEAAVLGPRSVVVVDEASTLGNRDFARLSGYVERAGATLRLVGDPAQHSAVAAGGAWRHLVEEHPGDTPALTELRRQKGPEMAEVRLALTDYREGRIAEALQRLEHDDRVVEADSPDELLDALVADWYVDRQLRTQDPATAPSSMVAEHHVERAELNRRARAVLSASGELDGPVLEVAGAVFQRGDEVIARKQDRDLRPAGGGRGSYVRNGSRGRVVEVKQRQRALVVDFEDRGRVTVPEDYLSRQVRPGVVGGLAHSYAVTSHAAQGETYAAGRHLASDASNRAGVYVGLSRGSRTAALYLVRRRDPGIDLEEYHGLPRLEDRASTKDAVSAKLLSGGSELLASELDPLASEVARLRSAHTVQELSGLADGTGANAGVAARALAAELDAVASRAQLHADAHLVARLGDRPGEGPGRALWDEAVGAAARHQALWPAAPVAGGRGATWALGLPPEGPAAAVASYRGAAAQLQLAETIHTATRPTAALAEERRQLLVTLGAGPDEGRERLRLEGDEALAGRRLADQQAQLRAAETRVAQLGRPRRRSRNGQALEHARRAVESAQRSVAAASRELEQFGERLSAFEASAADRAPARERLATVEAALAHQVDAAVARAQPYLITALGPRPADEASAAAWQRSALLVERYRHNELGLAPVDGPLGDSGLAAAVGERPDHPVAVQQWQRLQRDVTRAMAPPERGLGL